MPFRRLALAAALTLAAAVPARAQRDRDNANTRIDKPHLVTADSVERLNPISPLIARRREIGIPDAMIGKLGAILAQLDATNARALRQIDSLAANPAAAPGEPADAGQPPEGARRGVQTVSLDLLIGEITKNNDDAAQKALALLSGDAAGRALRIVNDQRNKLHRLLEDSGFGLSRGR